MKKKRKTSKREIQWEDLTRDDVIAMCDPLEVNDKLAELGFDEIEEGEDQ